MTMVVILIALVIISAIYGVIKNNSSSKVSVDTGEVSKKENTPFQEQEGITNNKENKRIFVHMIGWVKSPGVISIPDGSRMADALQAAGGAKNGADLELINLAYKLEDGQQVYIPGKEKAAEVKSMGKRTAVSNSVNNQKKSVPRIQSAQASMAKMVSSSARGVKADELNQAGRSKEGLININNATLAELDSLLGIGPSTAQKIIDYRNNSGRFKVPEDIMKVKGIGKSKYEQIKSRIIV